MRDVLSAYPVTADIPVAWGEMDALGHVNNIVYIRYFESGRAVYMRQIGFFDWDNREATIIGPILASINCRFRYPLVYPDTITVGVRTVALGEDRFTVHHRVVSHNAGVVAAEGEGVIVAYDYQRGHKTALPDAVRQAILALEGDALRT